MSKIETARNRATQLSGIAAQLEANLERHNIEPSQHLFQQIEDAIHAVERVRAEVGRLRDGEEEKE